MLILLSADGQSHAVAKLPPTLENPSGSHRLIGGGIEFGETAAQALVREVREELGATLCTPERLEVVENIFTMNNQTGHEIVFIFGGQLAEEDLIPSQGAMFSDDGQPMWVEWRPVNDTSMTIPIFPDGAAALARRQSTASRCERTS